MAEKAKRVFQIWHTVFWEYRCRVKRVLGIQGGFNSLNQEILSQLKSDEWDYGSPTHYFGLNHDNGTPQLNASSTVQDVMNNAQNSWNSFKSSVKKDYNNIKVFGKEVITYEGGQHFVGNSFGVSYPYQQAMWDAQNSPQMYQFYDEMHDTIRSWGCRLATNFSLSSVQESVYGSWGVLPDIDVLPPYSIAARKYQALIDNLPSEECTNTSVWEGRKSTSSSDKCNWSLNQVPDQRSSVIIKSGKPYNPSVNMNAIVRSLYTSINTAITILTGYTLQVHP
jgi:hypothetical protein